MFKLEQAGAERGDCTAPYRVILDKEYTVKEFIATVLKDCSDEWGYIGIKSDLNVWFGDPNIEYRYGEITNVNSKTEMKFPLEAKVLSAKADGGWSRMDYMLTVKADEVVHGHWVQRWTGNEYIVFCSKCRTEANEIVDYELEYNYCPKCGAKMDEVSE